MAGFASATAQRLHLWPPGQLGHLGMNGIRFRTRVCFLIWSLCTTPAALAEVSVLVHGWASGPEAWLHSGVVERMRSAGWRLAPPAAARSQIAQESPTAHTKWLYLARLPAEAPLLVQAEHLTAQLRAIAQKHPDDPMALVGHSAGGVVARLVAVRNDRPELRALITIATPNLGTGRAVQGLEIAESRPFFCPGPGFDLLKSVIGGDDYEYLKYSRGTLVDLAPAVPGSLLEWLNRQPHPDTKYISFVRVSPAGTGDSVVPWFSQDLNQVPALQGRAQTVYVQAGHSLAPVDGDALAEVLGAL